MTGARTISRTALAGRIEPFLLDRIDPAQDAFAVNRAVPQVSWNRLDLAMKLIYLDGRFGLASDFANALYAAHIKAFSLGDMSEPGNARKSALEDFRTAFDALGQAIADQGFDASLSLVPLASDGSIVNGAHRVAAALYHGQPVAAVETGLEPVRYDYRFFRSRGFSEPYLEAAVQKYVAVSPDAKIALLWPAAGEAGREVENIVGPLVFRKSVRLGPNGAHNLLSRVYANEPWLGPAAENFPGIERKLVPCFSGTRPLRVLVFDAPPGRDLVAMKDEIRAIFGIGKHSIHITDTHAEAVELAGLLLNENSLHFLEHARPNRFPQVGEMVEDFRAHLARLGVPEADCAIDSGMVLGAYGLRAPQDVDFIAARPVDGTETFEWHTPKHHALGAGDLLRDPARHFTFWGMKFISLELIAAMKERRRAGRDLEDLAQILPLLDGHERGRSVEQMRYKLRFAYSRARRAAIRLLDRVGLKDSARRAYHALRRR